MKQKQVTSNIFNIRKKSTKINLIILSVTLIFCFLLIPDFSFAHSGSLDSNGGHWDRSTNEYHYHHGYEAHQHPDGVCPYNFVDNANRSNGDSAGETTYKHTTAQQKRTTQHSTKPSQNNDYSENSMLTDTFFVAIIILVLVAGIVAICRYKKAKKKKETLKTFANVLQHDINTLNNQKQQILHQLAKYTRFNRSLLEVHHVYIEDKLIYISEENFSKLEELKYFFPNDYYKKMFEFDLEDHILAGVPEQYHFINSKLHFTKKVNNKISSLEPIVVYSKGSYDYKKCIHLHKGCCGAYNEIHFSDLIINKIKICSKCCYHTNDKFLLCFSINHTLPSWYNDYIQNYNQKQLYNIDDII